MIVGVGVDIIEIDRIARAIERRREKFVSKIYTDAEIAYCDRHHAAAARYAGRFAAKEAAMKALGVGWGAGAGWRELEVTNDDRGKPLLHLKGSAARTAEGLGVTRMHVSLSHSRGAACAVVVLES